VDWAAFLKIMIEDEKAAIAKYQIAAEHASQDRSKRSWKS
jgi:hypothetical protein